jgi:hypothetical protein
VPSKVYLHWNVWSEKMNGPLNPAAAEVLAQPPSLDCQLRKSRKLRGDKGRKEEEEEEEEEGEMRDKK